MTQTLDSLPSDLLVNVCEFINQNDLCSLAAVSRKFNDVSTTKLYRNISLSKQPSLRTDKWYIDSNWSTISGYSGFQKRDDQNDYFLHLRTFSLLTALETPTLMEKVQNFRILGSLFTDGSPTDVVRDLVTAIGTRAVNLKSFYPFYEEFQLSQRVNDSTILTSLVTSDPSSIVDFSSLRSLTINLHRYTDDLESKTIGDLSNLEELVLVDEETASLRILRVFADKGMRLTNLKKLVFNHVHGLHDYNAVLRALTLESLEKCVDLANLKELEMVIGCEEQSCECLGSFLDELAPQLESLCKLSLHEKTYHRDHYITENWDVQINRFLLNIPSPLRYLTIRHNPPTNGKLENGVEGNYLRRRKLYETVIPQLQSLETFISPTLIQSAACYEVLVSDILWNGCECQFCKGFLPFFDKYLMDHQYYDNEDAGFKDMISPRLFGVAGNEFIKRHKYFNDLDILKQAPLETHWNLHGYDSITCFDDVDCVFDERFFEPFMICVSHFFVEVIKVMQTMLPNLKTVVFSGIYFQIKDGEITCLYDREENIK